MKWLLDTNVVSESIRPSPNRIVSRWLLAQEPELTSISIVTLAELQYGAAVTETPERKKRLIGWLAAMVIPSFADRTLPLTEDILIRWIDLSRQLKRLRKSRAAPDMLIAATARVHGLTIVTRNVGDFADTGVVVYDPWHDKTHRMGVPSDAP